MAQYTEHFGLHQWESADPFLRTDFNTDFSRLDTVLDRLRGNGEANAYDIYNLMLQNHYEGKYTGYKKGLLFSAFREDEAAGALRAPQVFLTGGRLALYGAEQGDIDLGYYDKVGSKSERTSAEHSPDHGGLWTGFTCRVFNNSSSDSTKTYAVTARLMVNGAELAAVTASTGPLESHDAEDLLLKWPEPLPVGARDLCSVRLTCDSSLGLLYPAANGESAGAGGVFHFTPVTAATGWFRATYAGVPGAEAVLAWIRHTGGSMALSVTDGTGKRHVFSPTETRSTAGLDGTACTESAFLLRTGFAAGDWTVELTLDRQEAETMEVLDYGLVIA